MQPAPSVSPYVAVLDMVLAHWHSAAISAVAKLGIADQLESGPKSTQELASALNLHEESLYRVLRALAGLGVFHEGENRTFSQTPLSDVLRTKAKPSLRYGAAMMIDDWQFRSFQAICSTLENGKTGTSNALGMELFEYLAANPDQAFGFNRGMTDLSSGDAPAVVASYDFSGFEHIVDVAGGVGGLLAAILESAPRLRGTLFDQASVIEQAKSDGLLASLSDRCDMVSGSFFESVPQGADAYIMKHIIHDWEDERASKILSNCRSAMKPGGKLLVVDRVIEPPNASDPKKFFDIAMMLIPGGRERAEAEWSALFARSGFEIARIIPTPCPHSIIEGNPV
jgi:O-methyltransferase/methyltransferase family protein